MDSDAHSPPEVANLPTPHLDSGLDLLPPTPFNPLHPAFLWELYL